jgi:lysophospholipase L1-like esterase
MIVFHLAGSDIPVEVAAVTLHGPPAGQRVDPVLAGERFFIRHQRNALGCRDRDYVSPPPKHTVRILTLGDGFTSGVGVHEKDAFAKQLERELNGQSPRTPRTAGYEVINCGVPGYGTHEQRLFFELFGATNQPDIVLVTMGWNDDRFYWEASRRELFKRGPSRIEQLSSVVRKIDASRRLWRSYDYRRSVEDLLALDKAARARGARLIVAVSRHGPAGLGDSLLATVRGGIAGSAIPLLDLGTPEAADSGRGNPNDLPGPAAHRAVALELLRWLRKDVLASPAPTGGVP